MKRLRSTESTIAPGLPKHSYCGNMKYWGDPLCDDCEKKQKHESG